MATLSRAQLGHQLRSLGLRPGDLVMVHASLKALGPVEGGAAEVVRSLMDSVAPDGTLMAYASWDRSPYEETLNGVALGPAEREAWPAFDPATAQSYRGFGLLNEFLCRHPDAVRSGHPDASIVAIGARAREVIGEHRLGQAFGPGSPLERLIELGGKVIALGSPLDALTVLHYAEAVADIPHKRRVTYEMPLLDELGRKVWCSAEDFDSNGLLDCFVGESAMDAVESIARAYVAQGRALTGRVGLATCHLFDAQDLANFGRQWLERNFGF